jgi:transcriptional regulator with XRE-family HTH domain
MAETFGRRIRARRKEMGLTLDQLAEAAGCSKSYVWELENKNPPRPSAEKLSSIATALGTTTDYLLALDSENSASAADKAFFRKYQSMSDPTKDTIRQMLDLIAKKNG